MCFFYLIEQHSKFLWHTLQVLYMCTLCDSTNINMKIKFIPNCFSFYTWTLSLETVHTTFEWNCQMVIFFPNLVQNCHWTIVTDWHSWNVSTQNAFSLPFTTILVNRAPIGEMHNYCTPHIIKENFENFLIHRCNFILLSQVYCVWQVVKTPTIIFNNPVFLNSVHWRLP